ncbi:MAG: urease accessory protein UreD [Alphaproteobacteria bacterium]|nr:urease accessory protein UreD [Alphaproteobacteria bacterium]
MKVDGSAALSSDLALQRSRGRALLRVEARGGACALVERYCCAPLRILTPRPANGVPEAVIANLAGGIAGGDQCEIGIAVGPGAEAVLSSQAAEKVYRAIDAPAAWMTRLTLGPGATLEWLPQETILFDGARLGRRIEVDMAGDARLLAVETLVFGRAAHGERIRSGDLADRWRIDRDGRPVWRDALHIQCDAFEAAAAAQAGLRGARVSATLIYAAPDAPKRLEELRCLLADMSAFTGATAVRGLVAARFLAREGGAFKRELAGLLGAFRASVFDRPVLAPRVWLC